MKYSKYEIQLYAYMPSSMLHFLWYTIAQIKRLPLEVTCSPNADLWWIFYKLHIYSTTTYSLALHLEKIFSTSYPPRKSPIFHKYFKASCCHDNFLLVCYNIVYISFVRQNSLEWSVVQWLVLMDNKWLNSWAMPDAFENHFG